MKNDRFKNLYFWIGICGVILTAMGVRLSDFQDWTSVKLAFTALISNPSMLITTLLAIMGVFIDPTTKGLKDNM